MQNVCNKKTLNYRNSRITKQLAREKTRGKKRFWIFQNHLPRFIMAFNCVYTPREWCQLVGVNYSVFIRKSFILHTYFQYPIGLSWNNACSLEVYSAKEFLRN